MVVFETRAEMDCIIEYLHGKYPISSASPQQSWAIGLKSSSTYQGVYQWRPNDTSLTFDNFSSTDGINMGECVYMEMGSPYYGQWKTTSCVQLNVVTTGLYAICERRKM